MAVPGFTSLPPFSVTPPLMLMPPSAVTSALVTAPPAKVSNPVTVTGLVPPSVPALRFRVPTVPALL